MLSEGSSEGGSLSLKEADPPLLPRTDEGKTEVPIQFALNKAPSFFLSSFTAPGSRVRSCIKTGGFPLNSFPFSPPHFPSRENGERTRETFPANRAFARNWIAQTSEISLFFFLKFQPGNSVDTATDVARD